MKRRSHPAADRAYHDKLYRTRIVIERFFNHFYDTFRKSGGAAPPRRSRKEIVTAMDAVTSMHPFERSTSEVDNFCGMWRSR
jgi:hypothetical protein